LRRAAAPAFIRRGATHHARTRMRRRAAPQA
jgi:hypothetical protein